MTLLIDDPATEAAVQKLASESGLSPVDAVRVAVENRSTPCAWR